MSRRNRAPKRNISPDPKYGDLTLSKFINFVMLDGEKTKAEKIVYQALDEIKSKDVSINEVDVFKRALTNVSPLVEVKSRRMGASTYQVPVEVRPERRQKLGMKWIIREARKKAGSMTNSLAAEISEASEGRGASVKKREDTHKMAEANKAFAHFRW